MSRFFASMVLAAASLAASSASAGILGSALTFNGQVDRIRDESVGVYIDGGAEGVGVGDVIQGIVTMSPVNNDFSPATPPPTTTVPLNSVFAAYALEVESVTVDPTGDILTLKPATGANSLSSILTATGFDTTGLINSAGTLADGAFAVFGKAGFTDITDMFGPTLITAGKIGTVISKGEGWALEAVAGLIGDDLYQIKRAVGPPTPGESLGIVRLAASVLYHDFGTGVVFNPLTRNDFAGNPHLGDIVSDGTLNIDFPDELSNAGTNDWDFDDDGNFLVNVGAVPEPTSIAIFGVLGAYAAIRRRRA